MSSASPKNRDQLIEDIIKLGSRTGQFSASKGKDTDVWALQNNYVSVVPVQFDLTNYTLKKQLEKNWKIK